MRAQIREFHIPDADPLEAFRPTRREQAGARIEMMMSPEGEPGEESFQIVVGTREYFDSIPHREYAMNVSTQWEFDNYRPAP